MGAVSTKQLVFAISLASSIALVAGLFMASEVRASALEGGTQLPIEVDELVEGALDPGVLDQAQAFDGEWVFVGGQREREGIDAAIATSLEALSPMVRGIAAKRLEESNPVPRRVSISVVGEHATISFDDDGHKAKLDGTPIKAVSKQGDKIKVSHKLQGSKLIQFIDSAGGDRHNHFRLNAEGTRLTAKVMITSSHLPVPVEYRLSFKRK